MLMPEFYISPSIVSGDSATATVNKKTFELLGLNAQQHYGSQAFWATNSHLRLFLPFSLDFVKAYVFRNSIYINVSYRSVSSALFAF